MTPFSVMMPVTRLWGVTSKAGLQTSTDSGAVRVPYRVRTSSLSRSSMGMPLPSARDRSMVEQGRAT